VMKTVIDFNTLSISGLIVGTITNDIFLTSWENNIVYGIEMAWPEIKKLDLKKIDNLLQYILFVARPPMLVGNYDLQNKCTEWFSRCRELCNKGDITGLYRYLNVERPIGISEISSAQFVYQFLRFMSYGLVTPFEWEGNVSVADIENWTKNMEWHIRWIKVVPEDYKE